MYFCYVLARHAQYTHSNTLQLLYTDARNSCHYQIGRNMLSLTAITKQFTLCYTQVLPTFDFLCKIGDFIIAQLVCLQNKVC